jgi:IMP dehydrogenase
MLEGTRLTFDDVLLVPQYSEINSRETIDLSQDFLGFKLDIPILSANMDLVTGAKMAIAMRKSGGLGILHRFYDTEDREYEDFKELFYNKTFPIAISVGIRDFKDSLEKISWIGGWHSLEKRADTPFIVCIDVAHGHHKRVRELIVKVKEKFPFVKIIAGNVSTWDGYLYLANAGVDAVKVGIGGGSACTTRIVTGFGYPQFSAIMDIADKRLQQDRDYPAIISDGGHSSSGDIVKSLAAGADVVMLGNLLAGTEETPGEVLESVNGRRFRRYRGQSIFGANGERYVKEGVSGFVEEKGPVTNVLKYLVGGIRSGLSYAGATNLKELRENAEFIQVSAHTVHESNPRLAEVM